MCVILGALGGISMHGAKATTSSLAFGGAAGME